MAGSSADIAQSVLLFRAPADQQDGDKYHKALNLHGFQCTSIPVLSFEFGNLDKLEEALSHPLDHGGIILTSTRAVEAMEICIKSRMTISDWKEKYQLQWQKVPTFVVGASTSEATCVKLGLQTVGHGTGSAQMLVPLIIEEIKAGGKPLLFPCGNLRKETIPLAMEKAGIALRSIQVYTTCKHPGVGKNLQTYVDEKGHPKIMVFFSPSGVDYCLPDVKNSIADLSKIEMIAIGKTTCKAMQEKGLIVSGVADKPTPGCLAQCIKHCC